MKKPIFYNSAWASKLYLPRYDQIYDAVQQARKEYTPSPNKYNNALFLIDPQVGFCTPGASLYVHGTETDIALICEFIFKNLEKIDDIFVSLDTHTVFQIHTPAFWINRKKENPEPMTVITLDDIKNKKWKPYSKDIPIELIESYLEQLEKTGKYLLITWDFHTQTGSVDHGVTPILFETLMFFSMLTCKEIHWIVKGENPLTENYSVFSSEIQCLHYKGGEELLVVGEFNDKLLAQLNCYNNIYIAGEASSHCVKETIEDIIKISTNNSPDKIPLNKINVLTDCMSPVPKTGDLDFPRIAQDAFKSWASHGVNITTSREKI